jgi:hypothetical protein
MMLAKDGRSYSSRGTAEWFDANNSPAPPFKTCSTSTATRFRQPGDNRSRNTDVPAQRKNSSGEIVPAFMRMNPSMAFWLPCIS